MAKIRVLLFWIIPAVLLVLAGGFWGIFSKGNTVPLAFVANAGGNNVQVIDLSTGETLTKIYAGITPWRLLKSPDGRQLWVQHWYSQTTSVIDLDTLEIVETLPVRGPGVFTYQGDRFLSFDWPGSMVKIYDVHSFAQLDEKMTEARQPYAVTLLPGDERLLVARYHPMSQGPQPRYTYVTLFDMAKVPSRPVSYRTGVSPVDIALAPSGDFFLTADQDSSQLTLMNIHGDSKGIPTCPGPHEVILSSDGQKIAVLCWDEYTHKSAVDWSKKPWPEVTRRLSAQFPGKLQAGRISPDGKRLYVIDQDHQELLTLRLDNLKVLNRFLTNSVPYDLEIVTVSPEKRDQLINQEREARKVLQQVLGNLKKSEKPVEDLSYQEVSTWTDPETGKEQTRTVRVMIRSPDSVRIESEEGTRLAKGGRIVFVRKDGRFWDTPRQDLSYLIPLLVHLPEEEMIRQLAGDLPDSLLLKGGLAVDLVKKIEQEGHPYYIIGTQRPETPVAQLWIDGESWRPVILVEKFPSVQSAHEGGQIGSLIETRVVRYQEVAEGLSVPVELERVLDGEIRQKVRLEQIKIDQGFGPGPFDLARLGGIRGPVGEDRKVFGVSASPADMDSQESGASVPSLGNDHIDHPSADHLPYNSNPPTSGPHVPYLAKWGIHTIPIPPEVQVHNLEDGGVLMQYNCPDGCEDLVERMKDIAKRYDRILLAPYPLMKARIALTAWGRILTLEDLDEQHIVRFIESHIGIDHHPSSQTAGIQKP